MVDISTSCLELSHEIGNSYFACVPMYIGNGGLRSVKGCAMNKLTSAKCAADFFTDNEQIAHFHKIQARLSETKPADQKIC